MRWPALALTLALALLAVPGAAGSEAKPRFGGTVVVNQLFGPTFGPPCLGPLPPCTDPNFEPILGLVLDGAFKVAPDLTYRPNLVSRVTIRKRPFTLTYHIRRDARWGDGTPLTAHDFAFTHQYLNLLMAYAPRPEDPVHKIRRVRVVDSKTFEVFLGNPFAGWRELFHRVYPRHALVGRDPRTVWQDAIVDPKTGKPTGSGPFLIGLWERDRNRMTLVRNPYWKPRRPYVDRIVLRFGRDLVPPELLLTDVDLVWSYRNVPPAPNPQHATPGPVWEHIAFRLGPGGHPALKDVRVRRALAYGIDREALLRRLSYGGFSRLLQNGILLTNSRFYERHWHDYRYRPGQATRLLEEAGCNRGTGGIYMCGGRQLSLRIAARSASEIESFGIPVLQEQLRRIGIELVPVLTPVPTFFDTVLPGGDFDLALFSLIGGPEPSAGPWPAVEVWRCGGRRNFTGYCNRQVTRKLLQSQVIVDQKTRMRLLNRVDALMARDVPMLPLFQIPDFLSFKPALKGVRNNPWEGFTWNAEDWWLAR